MPFQRVLIPHLASRFVFRACESGSHSRPFHLIAICLLPLANFGGRKSPDQPTTKLDAFVCEDTGAPLIYFDIVGAYGTMNGSIKIELATRILVPKPDGSTDVKFISSCRLRCTQNAATRLRNPEDAGAAAGQHGRLRQLRSVAVQHTSRS